MMKNIIYYLIVRNVVDCYKCAQSSRLCQPTNNSDVCGGGGGETPPVGGSAGVPPVISVLDGVYHKRSIGEDFQSVPGGKFSISWKLICPSKLIFYTLALSTFGPGNLV